jgi:hypothetical protein
MYKDALVSHQIIIPRLGICGRHLSIEIAAPAKQGSPHHWTFSKAHTGP